MRVAENGVVRKILGTEGEEMKNCRK